MRPVRVGEATIGSLIEREGPWRRIQEFLPDYDHDRALRHLAEMPVPLFEPATGRLSITYQTFVVRTPRHTMLVDTCTGEHKNHPPPFDFPKHRWLEEFRAAGLSFEEIDYVFCTHLHVDHSGWNTRLVDGRWVPTFPNAKYIFHEREYAAWQREARAGRDLLGGVWRMNCLPVVEAGQALLVDDGYALDDLVTLTPTPGHSPCHCCVNIASGGQRASITGDLMHHPLQVREPDWSTPFDWDPAQAAQSRRRFFAEVADSDTLILPVHFPSPTAGHITGGSDGFHYHFLGQEAGAGTRPARP